MEIKERMDEKEGSKNEKERRIDGQTGNEEERKKVSR